MSQLRKPFYLLCLLAALTGLCGVTHAQSKPPADKAAWAKRLSQSDAIDTDTTQMLQDLAALDPDTALEILKANFEKVPSEQVRGLILSGLLQSPRILDLLDFALDDPSPQVQYAANALALNFSLRYFTFNTEYRAWYRTQAGKSALEVARNSAREFVTRFEKADEKGRDNLLETLLAVDLQNTPIGKMERAIVSDASIQEAIAKRLTVPSDRTPDQAFYAAFQLISVLDVDDAFIHRVLLPLTGKEMPREVQSRVIYVLSRVRTRWAAEALNTMLIDHYPSQLSIFLLQQLAQLNDPHYIPTFISFLDASESPDMIAFVGKMLRTVTGVDEDTGHNRVWWRKWWDANKAKFAPDVQAMPYLALPPLQEKMHAWAKETVSSLSRKTRMEKERMIAELRGDLHTLHFVQQAGYQAPFARAEANALIDAGIFDVLAKMLAVPGAGEPTRNLWLTLQFLELLKPNEAFSLKYILPLAEKTAPQSVRYQALMLLGNMHYPWVIDRMSQMLVDEYPGADCNMLAQMLGQMGDPQVIPILIGVMEADDTTGMNFALGQALSRLTEVNFMEKHDGEWWHGWWMLHKARFPTAKNIAIPVLKPSAMAATEFHVRHKYAYHAMAYDPQHAYWLVSPGFVETASVHSGARPKADTVPSLGLIVVLASAEVTEETVANFWMTASEKAFKSRYYIAIVFPQSHMLRATSAEATQESEGMGKLAGMIVREVMRKSPIDPVHVFLMGAADSGMETYACSLAPQTPFKGFYLLASPFASAQLPPLTNAKGRRYFIAHSEQDKITGIWTANAARQLLVRNGAKVKLTLYHGGHGYDFKDDPWLTMGQAIDWLESAR